MDKLIEERVRKIKISYKHLLYAAMGILWSLANAEYSFGFLTWFALVPFLFLIRFETVRDATKYSLVFGFVFYLTNLYWVAIPFVKFFGASNVFMAILGGIIGVIVVIIISIWHGLSYCIAVFLSKYVAHKKGALFYLAFPIIMTAADYFFPKLWHDQIGYSQYIFLGFCQIADIFGVPVITLIVLSCNVAVIMIIEAVLLNKPIFVPVFSFCCVIIVVIVSCIYGLMKIDYIDTVACDAEYAKIAMIQGNYSGADKRIRSKRAEMVDTYNELTMSILDTSPDLVIWPECAVPTRIQSDLMYLDTIKRFGDVPLAFGVNSVEPPKKHSKNGLLHNSMFLTDSDGRQISHYDKMRLVPLSEQIPLPGLSYLMNAYGLMPFIEGTEHKIMEVGNIRFAPSICYEDIMPDFIRQSVHTRSGRERHTANLLINITNDSWFGNTVAPKIHMHISAFRAIETRRTLVRVTCTGHTIVCQPTGQITLRTNLNERTAVADSVMLLEDDPLFVRGGWRFVYILLIASLCLPGGIFIARWHRQMLLKQRLRDKRHQERLYQTWMD